MSIREIAQNFHNFCPKYHVYPTAFRVFSLLLPKFFHCFCPNFGKKQWEIRARAMGNSGKSNRKFGQKQWENLGKSNEKTRKAAAYISPEFSIAFSEFPFARISHCFCPNFSFSFFLGGGGAQFSLPPASYAYVYNHYESFTVITY